MIWPLPGAIAVAATDGQGTLGVSWQSVLQLSNAKQEVYPALAKTGIGPEALGTPSRTPTEQQVTKPGGWGDTTGREEKENTFYRDRLTGSSTAASGSVTHMQVSVCLCVYDTYMNTEPTTHTYIWSMYMRVV